MPFNKILVFLRKIICNRTPNRPKTSLILENHIRQSNYPYWTSYSVKYSDICNDQFGKSHFNWQIDGHNYHILRVGCYPFIKYHCTKRKFENLEKEDKLYTFLKLINLGYIKTCIIIFLSQ